MKDLNTDKWKRIVHYNVKDKDYNPSICDHIDCMIFSIRGDGEVRAYTRKDYARKIIAVGYWILDFESEDIIKGLRSESTPIPVWCNPKAFSMLTVPGWIIIESYNNHGYFTNNDILQEFTMAKVLTKVD